MYIFYICVPTCVSNVQLLIPTFWLFKNSLTFRKKLDQKAKTMSQVLTTCLSNKVIFPTRLSWNTSTNEKHPKMIHYCRLWQTLSDIYQKPSEKSKTVTFSALGKPARSKKRIFSVTRPSRSDSCNLPTYSWLADLTDVTLVSDKFL